MEALAVLESRTAGGGSANAGASSHGFPLHPSGSSDSSSDPTTLTWSPYQAATENTPISSASSAESVRSGRGGEDQNCLGCRRNTSTWGGLH